MRKLLLILCAVLLAGCLTVQAPDGTKTTTVDPAALKVGLDFTSGQVDNLLDHKAQMSKDEFDREFVSRQADLDRVEDVLFRVLGVSEGE